MDGKLDQKADGERRLEDFERRGPLERLGLMEGATAAQLKEARNKILKRFHPDAGAQDNPYNRGVAALANEAYEYLSGKRPLEKKGPFDTTPQWSWEKDPPRPKFEPQKPPSRKGFGSINETLNEMFRESSLEERAKAAAAKGAEFFHEFTISEMYTPNQEAASELISNPGVVAVIRNAAVQKIQEGFSTYNSYLTSWSHAYGFDKSKFDRSKIDESPEVYKAVIAYAAQQAKYGPKNFRLLNAWESLSNKFSLVNLANQPAVKAAIEDGLLQTYGKGQSASEHYIRDWRLDAGLDLEELGIQV